MQQNKDLSAYIDGEWVEGNFTEALCSSTDLQQKWQHYHTVRSVMRGEDLLLGRDFSEKMEALIENEEMDLQPKTQRMGLKVKRWVMPFMQVGIAASVCFVAVLGVNVMTNSNENEFVQDQPILQTLPFTNSIQQVSLNLHDEIRKIEDEKKKVEEQQLLKEKQEQQQYP
ncbi:sigma-E factor negative regulatory protein [Pasteurella atlantica]|uniref:RseA family anti-sigma factor n=2 Tax=Pasteurellaceae TaxID=712 RepID=A0ACC6HNC7_9PAST|nr:RseA family anti-sigma factor [Pasteurella atlantica]MDP8052386.1 RseA family anti-sigma factor [Pasteurella atlantica]MDP8099847.1 RseA family anti-sigma factor [Pasteurella atlantica]MDP8105224.1 RseA family anti-sigma factor [Pasteurella atlantica]MDP8106320.1 RseA family anti-sigma factor [Pasteurella atlantica]MDP8117493.1 RseA family anti-sigma factor [Pasteurella atlantica]